MKRVKMGVGRRGVRLLEEGKEWRLSGLLYAGNLVLCAESKEELRAMVGRFAELCRRRGLKVNAGKRNVMVLNGEEELEGDVHVEGIRLGHVSEFKYLGCVLEESGTDGAECSRKVVSGRKVAVATRTLVNTMDLQYEFVRVLHETLLVPVLIYGSGIMLWKEKERSKGLRKACSGGSPIWRGWRGIGLLRVSM